MYGNGRYEIEVWNKSGVLLGNIRHLASSLKYTKQRNQAETVEFTMDLARYEDYLGLNGTDPFDFMDVLTTDIRVKRDGKYIVGANVIKFGYSPTNASVNMTVSCTGYLNFFKTQYIDISYNDQYQGDILWGVINQSQLKDNADYGITRGSYTSEGKRRDRNETRKNVKDFMIRMTNVIAGPDFEFTPDKKFNSYDAIGSYRPDIRLVYPRNVDSFSFERSGDSLYNYVYALGSGNGDDAIQTSSEDAYSQVDRYRREVIATFNSVERGDTLQENSDGVLDLSKDVRELPKITLHDGVLDLNDISIGDTIYLELQRFKSLKHIKGFYRIEKIEVTVDDNDAETVSLTFDDLNIDDIIQTQED